MTYEFEGKTEQEAIDRAIDELGLEADKFDVEILDIQKGSIFKKGYAKIRIHVNDFEQTAIQNKSDSNTANIDVQKISERAKNFLETLLKKMGHEAEVQLGVCTEKKIMLRINTEQSSILIGRKGKTLDALQLITNIYTNKENDGYTRIIIDCENYRIRREESLVRLAYEAADKVSISRQSILLNPMNPYERRLIHVTLNDICEIETKSEGKGLYKQIRVLYKGR